ncbi:MAG: hypothetical protein QOH10_1289, partial [Actinomycetota bacterium]|nr:hypothetical protein [Actinomycetota bacterium]
MLTHRGWSLLGGSIGLVAGGRLLGLEQLWVLATTALLALLGSVVWTSTRTVDLEVTRHIVRRLQVGVDGRVDLTVVATGRTDTTRPNRRGRPGSTPFLTLTDAFDGGRRHARFLLPPIAPGAIARAAYRVPTERRGRYEIGPLRASVGDPFGLSSRTWRAAGLDEVIVQPRVHDVMPLPEGGGEDLDSDDRRVVGRLDVTGEFLMLREYAPGDDLRRVHWKSTARHQRMMIRQDESRRRAPVLVLLDVRASSHDRVSFELAVEAVASIVTSLERDQRRVEVRTTSGERLGQAGRRHLASLMDELAVIEPSAPPRLAPGNARPSAVVAVLGRPRDGDLLILERLTRRRGMLAVVVTRPDGRQESTLATRRTVPLAVNVTAEKPFPIAWNEAVIRWQRSSSHARLWSPS